MAGINFIGSYSGIDRATIDKLMEAERLPLVQLSNKKTNITEKQNAWKDINTRLNSLFERLKALQNSDTFTAKASTSTNDKIVTLSPSKNAIEGTYKINVKQLATNVSLIGGKIPSSSFDEEGKFFQDGYFTIINSEGEKHKIEIKKDDTIGTIVESINAATKDTKDADGNTIKGSGITASVIDGRIVLTDNKTGNRNITLTGDDNLTLTKLGLNQAARDKVDGQDAIFTINGVEITRTTNTISDAIEGVTINLHKEHTASETDTVTVAQDTEKLTKAIQDFVDQYNSTMKFIEDKLAAGDPDIPGSKGTLSRDSSLMRLHSALRNMVTDTVGNKNTTIKDMSQLGVSTIDRFGQLKFDANKLKEALKEDPNNVKNFFISKDDENNDIGFVPRLKDYVDSFITSDKGVIKGKQESFEKTLKDINRQIENFNARMERREEYYIKVFTALDVAMMQAENQMNWLQGQIDAMNASNSVRRK